YDKNNYSKIVFKSNGTFALRYKFVNEKNKTVQLGDLDYGMQYGYYDVYESVASFEVTGKHPYGVVDSSITDYNVEVYGDIVVLRAIDQNQDVGDFVMIHAEKL
ncbi:hypothetical protein KKA47_03420, partial [bacterium]|nr:hypothetical protein [bacterium]